MMVSKWFNLLHAVLFTLYARRYYALHLRWFVSIFTTFWGKNAHKLSWALSTAKHLNRYKLILLQSRCLVTVILLVDAAINCCACLLS